MAYTRSIIATQLAAPSEHRDLSYNLLNWVAWSLFVTEGSVQHRWTMTGDAKVLLARQNYYGSLSKQQYDCRLPGTVNYDRATGTFTMTYSHKDYSASDYCKTILKDSDVGYDAIANGDKLTLSWDGVSLLMVGILYLTTNQTILYFPMNFSHISHIPSSFYPMTYWVW
jgi:hypothetical protein